jgi:argininosuccinate lyase
VINSDRMECVHLLAGMADVRLSAVVKPKYARLYDGIAEVACVSDVANTEEVLVAAYSLMHGEPFHGVIAPLERSIVSAAFVRSYFGMPGMDLATAAGFANKFVMKRRLRAAGIAVADFVGISGGTGLPAAARALGWPVILKPAVGAGAQRTWRLGSGAEVNGFLAGPGPAAIAGTPMLVESYVPMRAELHCDGVVVDGATVALSASRYFRPLLTDLGGLIGSYTLTESDPLRDELRDLHRRVVEAMGLRSGVTHLEAFLTSSGLVMSEITCRPGGGGIAQVIQMRDGWDIWAAMVATTIGRPVAGPATAGPTATSGDAIVGWCGLPGRNGVITELTEPEELMKIDGVCHVDMSHRVGQVVAEKLTSTFNAGVAYFAVADYDAARRVHTELCSRYRIETRPAEAAPIGRATAGMS